MRIARPVALLALLACGPVEAGPVAWSPPPGAVRVPTPEDWGLRYAAVERCAGRRGDFAALRVHEVPDSSLYLDGALLDGAWRAPHDVWIVRSILRRDPRYAGWYVDQTVDHELMHDVLGLPGHPPAFARCGLAR